MPASGPCPAILAGNPNTMRTLREKRVDARCRVRYDKLQPTLCVTARPSFVRNLENFSSDMAPCGCVLCTPSFAFITQAFPGPRTKPQEGFGFSPVSARRAQGTQPARAMEQDKTNPESRLNPEAPFLPKRIRCSSAENRTMREATSCASGFSPPLGFRLRRPPAPCFLSPRPRSVSRRAAENAKDAETPPRHLFPFTSHPFPHLSPPPVPCRCSPPSGRGWRKAPGGARARVVESSPRRVVGGAASPPLPSPPFPFTQVCHSLFRAEVAAPYSNEERKGDA